jgi:hypothetical protein
VATTTGKNSLWSNFEAFMNVTGATGSFIWPDSGCNASEDCVCSRQCRFNSECDNPSDRNDIASGESHRCYEDCHHTTADTTVGNTATVVATEIATTEGDTACSGTV